MTWKTPRLARTFLAVALAVALFWSGAVPAAELSPQQVYAGASPGVVLIIGHPDKSEGGSGGTGSIIRSDGLVLTNAHVVVDAKTEKPYPRLFVFLKPDRVTGSSTTDLARKVKAGVVAYDRALDLALLKLESPPASLLVLSLGDPDRVRIGDRVVAIGHPEQGGLWTLTTGVVSAEFEDFNNTKGKHVFQTEVGLNRGNSGGPLLDAQGSVIGVNTAIARLAADGLPITSISFSLKSSVARTWLREQAVMVDYMAQPVESPLGPPQPPAAGREGRPAPPAQAPKSPAPKSAPPPAAQMPTEPHPYNLDRLIQGIRQTEKELNELMEEMHKKTQPR